MESNKNLSNKSLIEKFKCVNFYVDLVECIDKNEENEEICKIYFSKIGECVYKGMKDEEKNKKINLK
jgi:hypothetical protein